MMYFGVVSWMVMFIISMYFLTNFKSWSLALIFAVSFRAVSSARGRLLSRVEDFLVPVNLEKKEGETSSSFFSI